MSNRGSGLAALYDLELASVTLRGPRAAYRAAYPIRLSRPPIISNPHYLTATQSVHAPPSHLRTTTHHSAPNVAPLLPAAHLLPYDCYTVPAT